jgi:type IV secretory pathway TrbL component
MMVEINILVTILLLCLLSFFDFIVFNEEILLTLCFLSFLFYCFNTLSESVFSSFESRAAKFEQDLLLSFSVTKSSLTSDFTTHLKLQSFIDQFTILLASLLNYLAQCVVFLEYKPS